MRTLIMKRSALLDHGLECVDGESMKEIDKLQHNTIYRCNIKQIRNGGHHRKYFALIKAAYDCWEPPLRDDVPAKYADIDIAKSVDGFRKDVQILAGYYDAFYRLDGSVRLESKSIDYASLDQDGFTTLYDAVREVIANMIAEERQSPNLKELLQ